MSSPDPTVIELLAGRHPNGQPVIERLPAMPVGERNQFWLLQSPMFVPGIARGDCIELLQNTPAGFRMRMRSGPLFVRVFCRYRNDVRERALSPAVERIGVIL